MLLPVNFPHKLYAMLEYAADSEHASAVSWINDGQAFAIHDKDAFLKHIVPRFFNQTKYRSFTRQLNFWGFQRISHWSCAVMMRWRHEHFVRGKAGCLHLIERVEIKSKKAEHAKKFISPIAEPDLSPAESTFETHRRSTPSPPFAPPTASFAQPSRKSQEGSFAEIGYVKIGATAGRHNILSPLIARPSNWPQIVLPTKSGPSNKVKANSVAPSGKHGVQEPVANGPVIQSASPREDNGATKHGAYPSPAKKSTGPPAEEKPAPQIALPPGWKAAVDGDSGRVYYYRRQELPSEGGSPLIFGTGGCPAPPAVSVDVIVPRPPRESAEATREGAKIPVPDAVASSVPDVVTSCGGREISGSS